MTHRAASIPDPTAPRRARRLWVLLLIGTGTLTLLMGRAAVAGPPPPPGAAGGSNVPEPALLLLLAGAALPWWARVRAAGRREDVQREED
jgi:hypothetical protein